ncbi:uncharacterized protein VTP21DRAFT_4589 [Calcarisporiella thermophila]|uniref:uncharacterized protein n=1 Tax=Calcarisporiella thermophila TaxID=911321 RepID=UPI0037428A58
MNTLLITLLTLLLLPHTQAVPTPFLRLNPSNEEFTFWPEMHPRDEDKWRLLWNQYLRARVAGEGFYMGGRSPRWFDEPTEEYYESEYDDGRWGEEVEEEYVWEDEIDEYRK